MEALLHALSFSLLEHLQVILTGLLGLIGATIYGLLLRYHRAGRDDRELSHKAHGAMLKMVNRWEKEHAQVDALTGDMAMLIKDCAALRNEISTLLQRGPVAIDLKLHNLGLHLGELDSKLNELLRKNHERVP